MDEVLTAENNQRPYMARDPVVTSRIMSSIRSKNTIPELLVRRALWARGMRYRIHAEDVYGKPDIVFKKAKVAVFVDGDWWHGRRLRALGEQRLRERLPEGREDWWISKLERNAARDSDVTLKLSEEGWCVLRFWESDVRADTETVVRQIETVVELRSSRKEVE